MGRLIKMNIEPYIARYIRHYNYKQFNFDEIKFLNWMTKVEKIVYIKINLTLDDLEDELYRINFDAGTNAKDMAKSVLNRFAKMCEMCFKY